MRKFCFVMIAVAALVVAGSSNNAFAANATSTTSIVSPYWQADSNSIYTFISVSNPSVGQASSRAVTVTAVSQNSASDTASSTVTILAGATAKFFIANTNHSSINSNTVAGINWISTTGYGHVVVEAAYQNQDANNSILTTAYSQLLSAWGAIVIPGSAGFAMEFIGDQGDTLRSN